MRYLSLIAVTLLSLLLGGGALSRVLIAQGVQGQNPTSDTPLTDEQIRALTLRTLDNQHQDDMLLAQYARTEHDLVRGTGKGINNKETISRVVPTGTGDAKVELKRDGVSTDPAQIEKQWHEVAQELLTNSRTDDPDVKKEYQRAAKRDHERADIVDAVGKAFRFHYAGRETIGGRRLLKLTFDPNPSFRSSIRFSSVTAHLHGTVWVDESDAQIVRFEAQLFDDFSIVAGLVIKVYRGGSISLEQSEIEPGVWLPARTAFDLEGRKLLLAVTYHEHIEDSDYRRIGLPREALLVIASEHPDQAAGKAPAQR